MTQTATFLSASVPVETAIDRARYKLQHHGLAFVLGGAYHTAAAIFSTRRFRPRPENLQCIQRRFGELLDRDLANVEAGYYSRELLFQFPWRHYAARLPEILMDVPRFIRRYHAGRFDELPGDIDRSQYPKYYLRTFHWQTDGWFSERSARLYDADVELLFGGAADVMRRMTIPPVVDATRGLARPRILDLACGTGRFLLQLHQAIPQAALHGVDLSPHYVGYARKLLGRRAAVLAENAEQLPFADGTFDATSSIYLFHELPSDARRRVVREALRVLRPGGVFVINDSAQPNDSPDLVPVLEFFPQTYHEPYYKGYLRDLLEDLVVECGFELLTSEPHLVSKVVVARKPR